MASCINPCRCARRWPQPDGAAGGHAPSVGRHHGRNCQQHPRGGRRRPGAVRRMPAHCRRRAQAQTLSTASIASAVEELDGAIHTLSSHTEHVVTQAHSAETLADQAQSQLDSRRAHGAMRDTPSQAHGDVGELADKPINWPGGGGDSGHCRANYLLALNAAIEARPRGETAGVCRGPTRCANWPNTQRAPPRYCWHHQCHPATNPPGRRALES